MNCVDYLFENITNYNKDLVIGTHETISYKSLHELTFQIAGGIKKNIGIGKNVILISQNSIFFITVYLGIIKSGNICIPLPPSIEQKNLDHIIEKTHSELSFISEIALKKVKLSIKRYSEPDYLNIVDQESKIQNDNNFDDGQVAEIIYTSGSTSIPKGVMLTHKNIISNTNSIIQYLNIDINDIMQVVLPFHYCYGLSLLHTHIRAGAQLVLNNNFIFLNSTINNFNKYNCTGFAGVPSHFQILLRKTELFKKSKFNSLRYVTQAGGKLYNLFISEFTETFPSIKFFVMYGQTEATARLSYLPPEMLSLKMGSIGKGLSDVKLKVVNTKQRKIKPGEIGEIIAKGDNIMSGYYDDQPLTNKTIRKGWLYTGDLGTIDEDGYIYLTARKKEIIKVNGNRVSPKEIEEVIMMIPEVLDCYIEGVADDLVGDRIKSTIIISKKEPYITEEYIKRFCSTMLAAYKIPTIFEFRETMSINSTGKRNKSIN